MRAAVRLIDCLLRQHAGLFEFSQDPDCIFRLQLRDSPHSVRIGDQNISKGDPILGLHVWNERMPKIPPSGADLEWALSLRRCLTYSFKAVAKALQEDSRYDHAIALWGASALFSFSDHTGGLKMMQRLGFTVIPYHRPFGRFGEFWENLFSWWMMWAYNDASLQSRKFWHLQRTEIWMTRSDVLRRFG